MFVLALHVVCQPLFMDRDSGQNRHIWQGYQESRNFIRAFRKASRLQEIAAWRRITSRAAGAGFIEVYETISGRQADPARRGT